MLIGTGLVLLAPVVRGQRVDAPDPMNTLFAEALGSGIFWSINYEHTIYETPKWAFHSRIGLCIASPDATSFLALPVTFSGSFGRTSRAEVGFGITPFTSFRGAGRGSQGSGALFPTLHTCYRLQQVDGGFFARAGIMVAPLGDVDALDADEGQWGWNPILAVGVTF